MGCLDIGTIHIDKVDVLNITADCDGEDANSKDESSNSDENSSSKANSEDKSK